MTPRTNPSTQPAPDPFLQEAIKAAQLSLSQGGIPIGAVLVHHGKILGVGHNRRVQDANPILHGEISALQNAGRLPASTYRECVLYTTLSPCPMCSGAILLYKIPKVVIGENITFKGAEDWLLKHGVQLEILQNHTCIEMMRSFIEKHPSLWHEDIGES